MTSGDASDVQCLEKQKNGHNFFQNQPIQFGRSDTMTTVTYEIDGAVGIVTLAKPPHNLIDDALIDDLLEAYTQVQAQGCRAILLRSAMRHFCAGAEVRSFGDTTLVHIDQTKMDKFF